MALNKKESIAHVIRTAVNKNGRLLPFGHIRKISYKLEFTETTLKGC